MKKSAIIVSFILLFVLVGCGRQTVDAKEVETDLKLPVTVEIFEDMEIPENQEPKNEQSYTMTNMNVEQNIGKLPMAPDMINVFIDGKNIGFLYHYCVDGLVDADYQADVKRDFEGSMYLYYGELHQIGENIYVAKNGEFIPSWSDAGNNVEDGDFYILFTDESMFIFVTEDFDKENAIEYSPFEDW